MNYGISILFRAIPLAMALFCFGYGAFISVYGDDSNRLVAGPVVFSLGMICIALFATAATIIRQSYILMGAVLCTHCLLSVISLLPLLLLVESVCLPDLPLPLPLWLGMWLPE